MKTLDSMQWVAELQAKTTFSPQQEEIVTFVQERFSERMRHVFKERKRGKICEEIGEELGCHLSTVHREYVVALKKIQLVLEAPWLKKFREHVLSGGRPRLPEALATLDYGEICAASMFSDEEKQAILNSEHTKASQIAEETGLSVRGIRGTMKEEGEWPKCDKVPNDELIAAYEEEEGNITAVADRFGLERSGLSLRFKAMGYCGQGKRGRKNEKIRKGEAALRA